MVTKVELSEQLVRYVAGRAPQPRRQLRTALRALARERGDIRALEGRLENYHRLRVGGYRIIFAYRISGEQRTIQCILVERRSVVYEVFEQLRKQLLRKEQS